MAYKQTSPIPIKEGGTNTINLINSQGTLVFDGTRIVTVDTGLANQVFTSNGPLLRPTFEYLPTSASTFNGDTGSATGATITLAGGTNLNTSATGSTVTFNLDNTVSISGSLTAGTGIIATAGGLTSTAGGLTVTAGTVTISPFTTTGALVSNTSGVITDANASTAGFVLTSNGASSAPSFAAIIPGMAWNNVTSSTQALVKGNGYISNNGATLITYTLPATAAIGDIFRIQGAGTGLWTIAQNVSQTIHYGAINTTTGATGSLGSTGQYDNVSLICITVNTDFAVVDGNIGTLTYV